MTIVVQVVVNLLMLGSLYTLVSSGLSLVFGIMRVVNFAHAQFYMLGAYVAYVVYGASGQPYVLALIAAAVLVGILGVLVERIAVKPLVADPSRAMIATLGLLLILGGVALSVFGENPRHTTAPVGGRVHIFGAPVSNQKLLAVAISLVLLAALYASLKWTRQGQALRALAQNARGAELQGMRVGALRSFGFAVGAALAALAGALILPISSVTPDVGDPIILKMFIILILGGLGSLSGAALGAFLLAAFETVGVTYFGQFSILGVYVLVIAVLLLRPQGILGHDRS